jgi:hypothetical protein
MSVSLPAPIRYIPYSEVGEQPNIVVDGAPLPSTVLTLSHWPNNQTPKPLKRDTSTATVFAYLDTPALHENVDIVSNNHFDEDGLFSTFALCKPEIAARYRDLLIGGAMAGDFGVFSNRDAVRLCFIIEAFTDRKSSPLPRKIFSQCDRRLIATFYREMLERLPEILGNIDGYSEYWEEQDRYLKDSEVLIGNGDVGIEEISESDLAVVRIPANLPLRHARRYLQTEHVPVHPFAIQNATHCNRIIRIQDRHFELQYRYESWLQIVSYRPQFRVDLQGLAERLNSLEAAAGIWRAQKVTEIAPRLYLEGTERSSIDEDTFIGEVREYLATQPIAWDPYNWKSAE